MALGRRSNNEGGSTTYLSVALGGIWQKKGYSEDDPMYKEEKYMIGAEEKTTKGLCFDFIPGTIDSVYKKESDYGEFLNIYIISEGTRYCLQTKISGAWTAYNLTKRLVIALMSFDKTKPVEIHVIGNKDEESGFTNTTLWVKQDGKNLVLNPEADPEKFDESKQTAMPDEVAGALLSIETPSKEERKAMSKKKKERAREDELDEIMALFESEYMEDINAAQKARQAKEEDEAKGKSPNVEAKKEIVDEPEAEEEADEEETKTVVDPGAKPKKADFSSTKLFLEAMREWKAKTEKLPF